MKKIQKVLSAEDCYIAKTATREVKTSCSIASLKSDELALFVSNNNCLQMFVTSETNITVNIKNDNSRNLRIRVGDELGNIFILKSAVEETVNESIKK